MTTPLPKGTKLIDPAGKEAELHVVDPALIEGRIKLVDMETWVERYEPYGDIRKKVADGKLNVEVPGRLTPVNLQRRSDDDDKKLSIAMIVVAQVKQLMKQKKVSASRAYKLLAIAAYPPGAGDANHPSDTASGRSPQEGSVGDLPPVSRATVFRYLEKDRHQQPLLVGSSAKGNRTPRYSDQLRELVLNEAAAHFLQPKSTFTYKDLTDHVNILAHQQELLPPEKSMSRDFVSRLIHEELSSDPDAERMDPKDRASGKSIAKNTIRLSRPLQRVEQDGLHIPMTVRTPHGTSSNVWLVHAIDCYASAPVSWYLVIGSPTVADSLRCVERMLFSKTELLRAMGIDSTVDLYGVPTVLIFDNGPETKGERMQNLTRIGVTVMHCKARHAHGKPFIERLNKSLKEALQTLPGSTRFNGKDGERDPIAEGDELMELSELEYWIVRWYFDKWVHQPLKRLRRRIFTDDFVGRTPAQALKTLRVDLEVAMPLPPNRSDWQLVKYERETCTLSRKTGITTRTFNYGGENLPRLLDHFGEVQVLVFVDPDDFRFVWIPIGEKGELVRLDNKAVDASTPAFSFVRAKEMEAELPAQPEHEAATAFRTDILRRSTQGTREAAMPRKMTRAASKETTKRSKDHAAITRAAAYPMEASPDHALAPQGQKPSPSEVVWSTRPAAVLETADTRPEGKRP